MSALTTRERLTRATCGECGHDVVMSHANWDERCGYIGCTCPLSWVDALLASGAVIDAATLADDEGLVERYRYWSEPRDIDTENAKADLRALAAVLHEREVSA